jgi:hypothetical protein
VVWTPRARDAWKDGRVQRYPYTGNDVVRCCEWIIVVKVTVYVRMWVGDSALPAPRERNVVRRSRNGIVL